MQIRFKQDYAGDIEHIHDLPYKSPYPDFISSAEVNDSSVLSYIKDHLVILELLNDSQIQEDIK